MGELTRTCVLGGARTGKTDFLARRAEELAEQDGGAAVLVLAASPDAAHALARRIRDAGVRVTTPRELELELLADPRAQAATGRWPRLLLPFEENILLEDVKSSGVRPKRLREMLRFFRRSWTELADDDPAWLISDEEIEVHTLLKECLAFSGGILEPELAGLAVRWLRSDAQVLAAVRATHVLVDDYQLLSHASQELAGMIARDSLTVTGDPCATEEVFESYPYAAGLEAFAAGNGAGDDAEDGVKNGVEVVHLGVSRSSVAVTACCNALRAEACAGEADGDGALAEGAPAAGASIAGTAVSPAAAACRGEVELRVFRSPEEEIAHVVEYVGAAVEAGCPPQDIYVEVPNAAWAKGVTSGLGRKGIDCVRKPDARVLGGDVRDLERCRAARTFTLLKLADDERDMVAWRSWCGFGDWLAEAPGFAALRTLAALRGLDAFDALASLGEGLSEQESERFDAAQKNGLSHIIIAFAAGKEALRQLRGLEGTEVLAAAWRMSAAPEAGAVTTADENDMPASLAVLFGDGDGMDAEGLVARALGRLVAPGFSDEMDAVRIGSLAETHGQEPQTLVLSGFVDGFIPKHAYFDLLKTPLDRQPELHAANVRRVYQAVGRARTNVLVTAFTEIEGLRAEKLDLKVDRIFVRDGVRRARISPSELTASMGLKA